MERTVGAVDEVIDAADNYVVAAHSLGAAATQLHHDTATMEGLLELSFDAFLPVVKRALPLNPQAAIEVVAARQAIEAQRNLFQEGLDTLRAAEDAVSEAMDDISAGQASLRQAEALLSECHDVLIKASDGTVAATLEAVLPNPSLLLPVTSFLGGSICATLGLIFLWNVSPEATASFLSSLPKLLAFSAVSMGVTGAAASMGLLPPHLMLPFSVALRFGLQRLWVYLHRAG